MKNYKQIINKLLIIVVIIFTTQKSNANCFNEIKLENKLIKSNNCLEYKHLLSLVEENQNRLINNGYIYSYYRLEQNNQNSLVLKREYLPLIIESKNKAFLLLNNNEFNSYKVDEALNYINRLKSINASAIMKKDNDKLYLQLIPKRTKPLNIDYNLSNQSYNHDIKQTLLLDFDHYLGFYESLNFAISKTNGGKLFASNFSVPIQSFMFKLNYSNSINKNRRVNKDIENVSNNYTKNSDIYREDDNLYIWKPSKEHNFTYTNTTNWQYQRNIGLGFDRGIFNSKHNSLKIGLDFERRTPSQYQNDLKLDAFPLSVAEISFNLNQNHKNYINSTNFSISQGLRIGSESHDRSKLNYKYNPRAQFVKFNIDNFYNTKIFGKDYNINTLAQRSYHNLYDEEKLMLTSFSNVRGYYYESASVENGLVIKQDYNISRHNLYNFSINNSVFLDLGAGKRAKSKDKFYVSSFGINNTISKDRLQINSTFAIPLKNNIKPNYMQQKRSKGSLFINLKLNII